MENSNDSRFNKVHAFAVGMLEGTLSAAERQELESLLLDNVSARQAYLEYVQESACLRWLCAEEFENADEPVVATRTLKKWDRSRRRLATTVSGGLLAAALVVMVGLQFAARSGTDVRSDAATSGMAAAAPSAPKSDAAKEPAAAAPLAQSEGGRAIVATITSLNEAQWGPPLVGARVLSRWAVGDRLKLRSGSAELTFDAGAQVTVFGPAEFEITSATSIRCLRGRVTTLVDKRGRGFSIETPRAKVVDLGTQFGLSISDEGETEVVVFQGSVDLSYSPHAAGDAASRRMQQGEALLVKNSGEFERIVAVQRNSFMGAVERGVRRAIEPVIADVRDNIRNAQAAKSYQIVLGGLEDDALAFVDRSYQWNGLDSSGLPSFLAGADYIMPFNDDKFVPGLELKVRLVRPAALYVFLDNNMAVPRWLREEFTDTGVDLGLDCSKTEWHKDHSLGIGPGKSIDFKFSVWKREVDDPGLVTLGGLEPPNDRTQGFNMYGIAATAKE